MHSNKKHHATLAKIVKQKKIITHDANDISLTAILSRDPCQKILSECREFRDRIYTPTKTIFAFIKQVLNPDKSCKQAVTGVAAEHCYAGGKEISTNTGPYCKARARIPGKAIKALVKEVGEAPIKQAHKGWKIYGRELKVFDGSTAKMSDTKENQIAFPQHSNQKKGTGFPILRFIVVMSLTVGTVIDYAIGPYTGKGSGESSLLRNILDCIVLNDIVLGDRYFPNFFLIANLYTRHADGIFRGQSQRHYDFRSGERLGKNDHVALWKKPHKPYWMSQKEYDAYPEEIKVREFKVDGKIYVTTFLDVRRYNKKELAKIYERRWDVEINLKCVKDVMSMDMLSCKTPDMVTKEIGIHFLAYNFIRIIMAEACMKYDAIPWKVSFKGSVQLLNEFMPYFVKSSERKNKIMYAKMLRLLVKNEIGNRPGRIEPRAVKQRPKAFPRLIKSRIIEKERLMMRMRKMILRNAAA